MAQENLELVRRVYQAFNEHDLEAMLVLYTEDVEWRLIGGFEDVMGSEFRGREGLRRFLSDWIENLGGDGELETVLEAGERVVLVATMRGAGGLSGAPADVRYGQVISFRDGLMSAVDTYYEASEALEAVGLTA